ncbi:MAG: hypothetical protein GY828_02455, partial [Candidatus Gracilibacteria bacterium]|nr:hypothetical protein [Candidatus Gracilibacteria bacterium]
MSDFLWKGELELPLVNESDLEEVLEASLKVVRKYQPDKSKHHFAFANVVGYLVTGYSGGYGGPYIREHYAVRLSKERDMSFEKAVRSMLPSEGPLFREFTDEHKKVFIQEHCFNDPECDIEAIKNL